MNPEVYVIPAEKADKKLRAALAASERLNDAINKAEQAVWLAHSDAARLTKVLQDKEAYLVKLKAIRGDET